MIKEPQSPFIEIDEDFVEEWIPVVDERIKPDMYEISTAGRVRNKNTGIFLKMSMVRNDKLKPGQEPYYQYRLFASDEERKKGHRYTHKLCHRLVKEQFDPVDGMEKLTVNHDNGHKLDCKLSNLTWMTQAENNQHARDSGLNKNYGSKCHMSVLTEDKVEDICKLLIQGKSYTQILREIGMEVTDNNRDLIGNVKRKIAWRRISDKYF